MLSPSQDEASDLTLSRHEHYISFNVRPICDSSTFQGRRGRKCVIKHRNTAHHDVNDSNER